MRWFFAAFLSFAVAAFNVQIIDTAVASEKKRLLVFGDSLVAGYGLTPGIAFPDQLQNALDQNGLDLTVINGGISGDTMAGGASRIAWSLADRPDAVIVVLGGNDALRGLPADDLERQLSIILDAVIDQELPVLVAGMHAPANMGADYGVAFDQAFINAIEYAQTRSDHILFYPFFLDGVALEPHLNQADGIHPNKAGVAEIVRRIKPSVMDLLALMTASH